MAAIQTPELGGVFPILAWTGMVLVGLSVLMTLLDWGDLSGLSPEPPPRRGAATILAVAGVVLLAVGGAGVRLAG